MLSPDDKNNGVSTNIEMKYSKKKNQFHALNLLSLIVHLLLFCVGIVLLGLTSENLYDMLRLFQICEV